MAYHAGAGGPGFAKQPAGSQRGVGVWKEPGMPWPELLAWKMQSPFWPDFTIGLLASGKLRGQQPCSGEEGQSHSSGDAR